MFYNVKEHRSCQTNPMKRATIEDIRKHEWFTSGCPRYLFPKHVTDDSVLDTEAIAEVGVFLYHYL